MKALTLRAPWATAIARFGKDIENRVWRPPSDIIGQRIAIHEGYGSDLEGLAWLERQPGENDFVHGAVACTAVIAGWVDDEGNHSESLSAKDAARARKSKWYGGPIGWLLGDIRVPKAQVIIKGQRRVWVLPQSAAKRLAPK
jgi:hypothetical protein